jgi:uncharacterized repeat protein (TIGR03803 family)
MTGQKQDRGRTFEIDLWATIVAFVIALLMIVLATQMHAQTFTVLHTFTTRMDGANPYAGLTLDAAGNLYGTAYRGGIDTGGVCFANGCGTVFKLKHTRSGWLFTPIYDFHGGSDGAYPYGGVTIGRDGTLYSTAELGGGNSSACGTVFNLKPPPAACRSALCQWTKTDLYSFQGTGVGDGCGPASGLTYDEAGNLYGTTRGGGHGYGTVYALSPSAGGWSEAVLHVFEDSDGAYPVFGSVVFDPAGNLYGTTPLGGDVKCMSGSGCGVVFQLTPSGAGWDHNTLYTFEDGSDGAFPSGGVILDASGNLYGATATGGSNGGGTVFELSPSNGNWNFALLASLVSDQQDAGSSGSLVMDKAGNLYGTTYGGGVYGDGTVFKLTPSNGGWTYTSLHDFYCATDGCGPYSTVVFDADGNIYGTASLGGTDHAGTVWEITP